MEFCPSCHTGKIERRKVVFVQWQQPNSVVVDHIPAMVCDTCGEKSFDSHALSNLHHLLWSSMQDTPVSRVSRSNHRIGR